MVGRSSFEIQEIPHRGPLFVRKVTALRRSARAGMVKNPAVADNGAMALENGKIYDQRDYDSGTLGESDLPASPRVLFESWLSEAFDHGLRDPNAMVISTVDDRGIPSSRVVLARGADERGIVFYTNYESRKGREIAQNPRVSLLFHWRELDRVVRIEGRAARVSEEESDAYFDSRHPLSRIGSTASPQSSVITKDELAARITALTAGVESGEIELTRPAHWGGYLVVPDEVEFWQGRPSRLHDRFRYRRDAGSWRIDRLAP